MEYEQLVGYTNKIKHPYFFFYNQMQPNNKKLGIILHAFIEYLVIPIDKKLVKHSINTEDIEFFEMNLNNEVTIGASTLFGYAEKSKSGKLAVNIITDYNWRLQTLIHNELEAAEYEIQQIQFGLENVKLKNILVLHNIC